MIASANMKAAQATLEAAQKDQAQHRKTHNEGAYGFNPHDAHVESALADVRCARNADLLANAAEIRAAWNDQVKQYGAAALKNLSKIEKAVGATYNEMQWLKTQLA